MAQELTYYVCSDGLAPAITGRHPSGNRPILAGSSASVSWQAMNGDIAEGYKLRLTAGSVNFGTKSQAVPTLIDDGFTQLFNGVQDTYYNDKADGFSLVTKAIDPNVPWQKPSTGSTTVIDRQTERYLGQGFTYAMGKNGQGVCFIGWHKTLPDDYTKAALIDFTFHKGAGAFKKSTLVKKINEGHGRAACAELARWTFARGKDCKVKSNNCYGVAKRALLEQDWCMGKYKVVNGKVVN